MSLLVPLPPPIPERVVDTECYVNYWLCMFENDGDVEQWDGRFYVDAAPVEYVAYRAALHQRLARATIITFNGRHYDAPMIALALEGKSNAELKAASDAMIVHGVKSWDIVRVPEWIDHIDLFDVAPGMGSLKAYAGKMHSRRLQDLPFDPGESVSAAMRQALREYCGIGDLPATRDLRSWMQAQIQLRKDMSGEYGIDLRSKSDAQIAEAVMKKLLLPAKVYSPGFRAGTQFYYRPPAWLQYMSPALAGVMSRIATLPFSIAESGSPVPHYQQSLIDWGDKQIRFGAHGERLSKPKDWKHELVQIGAMGYAVGSGGLHSTESCVMHVADDKTIISDHDVASYYPSLILRTGIYPQQIGPVFLQIYEGWYKRRLAAKAAGNKKTANSLKTLLNGTFGKLGSPYSIFYAPSEMIQVTLTGQLALLMLIERLEICGVSVISANTDGIVLKTPRHLLGVRNQVLAWWEKQTGLVTEAAQRRIHAARDVNSYVAIEIDGTHKAKGAFAPPEPGPSGWPNPTGQISVDAAVAWLRDGTDPAATVNACTDVRQFVFIRQVKGGGSYAPTGLMAKGATQIAMREMFPQHCPGKTARQMTAEEKLALVAMYDGARAESLRQTQYLGKIVRWYYAHGSRGAIVTPAGGLVARTEGCMPLMQLPNTVPADIDRAWYIREAWDMLRSMGAIAPRDN